MKKGISPFIASVLLIAFTVAVAGIMSGWFTSFTKTSTETVEEHAEEELTCAYGGVKIYDVSYSSSTQRITGFVKNTGTITLNNISVSIICSTGSSYKYSITNELDPGEEVYFNTSIGCPDINQLVKVIVLTSCPSVSDYVSSDEISTT
ncbi:MAG: hypothetical protein J7K98_01920 [Candidatus Aenigmarchaeota archaeon]|nr:hypothetical protein [Candidatus Aenigmarchaeota archaeon]